MALTKKDEFSIYLTDYATLAREALDLDKLSHYIDKNIDIVRYFPYIVGAAGTFAIFRGVRLCTHFTKVSQVPNSFVKKNVELRGRLKDFNLDGSMNVQHLPVIRMPWHNTDKCLNVKLAYTNPTISGVYWMKLNLQNELVKFTIFNRDLSRDELVTLVKATSFKPSLNELLVSKGLATVKTLTKTSNKKQASFLQSLQKVEVKAKKEYKGMWEVYRKETFASKAIEKLRTILSKLSKG